MSEYDELTPEDLALIETIVEGGDEETGQARLRRAYAKSIEEAGPEKTEARRMDKELGHAVLQKARSYRKESY